MSAPSVVAARTDPPTLRHDVDTKPIVRKISAGGLALSLLGRSAHPGHLWKAFSLHRRRKANRRAFDDSRLAFYSQILPSDFLHYGFFDDISQTAEELSLGKFARAQSRYAELLIDLAGDPADPVLDVGCGMGGLSRMLKAKGFDPVALTPDRLQAASVNKILPGTPVIRCKFEKLDPEQHLAKFGTIFTAESLQYLKLDQSLPILEKILKPGGCWVACDYFLTKASADRTCHHWETFQERIADAGWKISYQRDVTQNVLPTLAFLHMLATRFGLPLMEFMTMRLRRKQPGIHHLLDGVLGKLQGVAADNVGLIDPAQFARDRQYMLLKLERA
jgi:MPBQ/MSBQ methyltransferase